MNQLTALLDFMTQAWPDQVIRGIPEDELRALEQALGRPLPGAYREALARLGSVVTQLSSGMSRFELPRVHEAIAARVDDGFARFVPIAGSAGDGPYFTDFFLDLAHPAGAGDARVVSITISGDGERLQSHYHAFVDLLWGWAFHHAHMRPFEEQTEMSWPTVEIADVDRALRELGFAPRGVTHVDAGLYERDDAAAYLYRAPEALDLDLHLMATTASRRLELATALVTATRPLGRRDMTRWVHRGLW